MTHVRDVEAECDDGFVTARERMVELQIASRGIEDEAVLRAMREVPREVFVPPEFRQLAYMDRSLPIRRLRRRAGWHTRLARERAV